MDDNKEEQRRYLAIHEAAHAVVAKALGLDVTLVQIRADGGGEVVYEGSSNITSNDELVEFYLAGPAASDVRLREGSWDALPMGSMTDDDKARRCVGGDYGKLIEARGRTEVRVDHLWQEILDLAERLLKDPTILKPFG